MSTPRNMGPSFRATGKGQGVKTASDPADSRTGNLSFKNLGLSETHRHHQIWMYCNGVSTSWSLNGSTSQAVNDRTFFARNTVQSPLVLLCQFPNQYEYDRFIEFSDVHHQAALIAGQPGFARGDAPGQGTAPLDVKLYPGRYYMGRKPDGTPHFHHVHKPMHVEGYIRSVRAGHQRFVYSPVAQIEIHVTNDFEHKSVMTNTMMNDVLRGNYINGLIPNGQPHITAEKRAFDSGDGEGVVDKVVEFGERVIDFGENFLDFFGIGK